MGKIILLTFSLLHFFHFLFLRCIDSAEIILSLFFHATALLNFCDSLEKVKYFAHLLVNVSRGGETEFEA